MTSKQAPTAAAPHATRRLFTIYLVAGVVFGLLGTVAIVGDLPLFGAMYLALGGLAVALGLYGRSAGVAVQRVNASLNLIAQGRLAESAALLDAVERGRTTKGIRRVVHVQRALVAMRRGDLDEALRRADAAVALPTRGALVGELQRANAMAIRAMIRAARGDREGAAADVAAVRATQASPPQALARAALAEAITLERTGDRQGLRELLARERALLLEATEPRERAIVRAYQRMLRASATSVYRAGASRDAAEETGDEPPLADWLATIAPGAAAYAPAARRRRAEEPVVPEMPSGVAPTGEARRAVQASRARAARGVKSSSRRGVFALVLVVAGVLGMMSVQSRSGHHPPPLGGTTAPLDLDGLAVLLVAALVAAIAIRVARTRRASAEVRRVVAATAALARGRVAEADRELADLTKSRYALVVAQAWAGRAAAAERRGDAEGMLACCDAGLARLDRYAVRMAAADLLLPSLLASRAYALTWLGRDAEAEVELAALPPVYAFGARDRFRVRMLQLVRQRRFDDAARLAEGAHELPLRARDELVADLARAVARPHEAGAREIERLQEEVADAEMRSFLERAAPGLLERFASAAHGDGGADGDLEGAEAEAEREHAALEEAEADAAVVATTEVG